MTRKEVEELVVDTYNVRADYPFEDDFVTGVFRHTDSGKWFGIAMNIPFAKIRPGGEGNIDVVNLKLPTEMFGSFGAADGVYPAYHMNKLHWISVLLPDAPDDVVQVLVNVSFEATKDKRKRKKSD